MNLADSRMDCLRGCLATLSVLLVRIALLEYNKIHEKAYKCIPYSRVFSRTFIFANFANFCYSRNYFSRNFGCHAFFV